MAMWDLAVREQAAIVTKDDDFAQRHALVTSGDSLDQASRHAVR
jgi:predicted nuclease of predicted toxin-antitoxin system